MELFIFYLLGICYFYDKDGWKRQEALMWPYVGLERIIKK